MKKYLAITGGDPSGISSEIIAKSLYQRTFSKDYLPIVIGNCDVIEDGIRITGLPLKINMISDISQADENDNVINVLEVYPKFDFKNLKYGTVQKESGILAYKSIEKAISLAKDKQVSAVVTSPINKESFLLGGSQYTGHTEMFAALTNTKNYSMILINGKLRVAHVTTHVSMRKAIELITCDNVLRTICVANDACKKLGIKSPKIAVSGLNPHAGENGMFGKEEIEEINPAIKKAISMGIDAIGSLPADTVFSKALSGMYDCVVAMYHDQGHIPVKLLGFSVNAGTGKWESVNGVNITFGLPIIRVSVDHGTAFGKAGKGYANPSSLIEAINIAIQLSDNN